MAAVAAVVIMAVSLLIAAMIPSYPSLPTFRSFRQLNLPPGKVGGEAIAFQAPGSPVFYTGVRDGVILQYRGPAAGWLDFAYTNPKRAGSVCDNTTDPNKGPVCGFPVGLAYSYRTRKVIIADAYEGLLAVGPEGGLAMPLATLADGVPFVSTNAVDVDPISGDIYFTDVSTKFQIRNVTQALKANDTTGRLMKYDVTTKKVTVLLRNLGLAVGAAVSADGSFVLVSEYGLNKVTRFWIRGLRANTAEPFLTDIVRPDNIRRTAGLGGFWIAARSEVLNQRSPAQAVSIGVRVDWRGQRVMETMSFAAQYGGIAVSEVHQSGPDLYVASLSTSYIGIYGL